MLKINFTLNTGFLVSKLCVTYDNVRKHKRALQTTYTLFMYVLKSCTCVPKIRYPHCAYAKKMIKNITAKPAISFAHFANVFCSWVMVLLKLMYLKTYKKRENE